MICYTFSEEFDKTEKIEGNSWKWAIDRNAYIFFSNEEENKICNLSFFLCPPPGKETNFVTIYIDKRKVMKVKTPQKCQISLCLPSKSLIKMRFEINDELVYVETGDKRGFAFQLVDFDCIEEKAYSVSNNLKNLHMIQVNALKFLVELCNSNNLLYYMFYGSLLGVVRHGEIIPWDDDIDIVMPRKDMIKLLNIIKNMELCKYEIEDINNGDDCYYGGYVKFVDSTTTKLMLENWNHQCRGGIGIDIFALDYISENVHKRNSVLKNITRYQELLFAKIYGKNSNNFAKLEKDKWIKAKRKSQFKSKNVLLNRINELILASNSTESIFVTVLGRYMPGDRRIIYESDDFGEGTFLRYGDLNVRVPCNYLKCLEISYGDNYMCFPKAEKRVPKDWALWDLERPYKFYQKKIIDISRLDKKVNYVVWGLGDRMKCLLENYSNKYSFMYIVTRNEKISGKILFGLMVIAENLFLNIYKEEWCILLCSDNISEDIIMMNKLNMNNYYIFIDDPKKVMKLL